MKKFLVGSVLVASCGLSAFADAYWALDFTGWNGNAYSGSVKYDYPDGTSGTKTWSGGAGALNFTSHTAWDGNPSVFANNVSFSTYCTDVGIYLDQGNHNYLPVRFSTELADSGTSPWTPPEYPGVNPPWDMDANYVGIRYAAAIYNAAQGGGSWLSGYTTGNRDWQAAVQLAVWEVLYDPMGSWNVTSGNFVVNSPGSTVANEAAAILTWLGGQDVSGLTSTWLQPMDGAVEGGSQGYLYKQADFLVPDGGLTATLLGMAFVTLAFFRRKGQQ